MADTPRPEREFDDEELDAIARNYAPSPCILDHLIASYRQQRSALALARKERDEARRQVERMSEDLSQLVRDR